MADDKRDVRIEAKLDKALDHIASIDVTLARQNVTLEEHIRRTVALEAQVKPIEAHVNMVRGAMKLVVSLAAIAAIIELVLQITSRK